MSDIMLVDDEELVSWYERLWDECATLTTAVFDLDAGKSVKDELRAAVEDIFDDLERIRDEYQLVAEVA
jgi:hypothetical protein